MTQSDRYACYTDAVTLFFVPFIFKASHRHNASACLAYSCASRRFQSWAAHACAAAWAAGVLELMLTSQHACSRS